MKVCKFEGLIDDYLLNKLSGDKKDKFEEHYFNCPSCFEKMTERHEIIRAIKFKGKEIFADELMPEEARGKAWMEKIFSFLTPNQWALAAVSAALILVVVLVIMPFFKQAPYEFQISDEKVRGGSIDLISPFMDIDEIPYEFRWAKSEKDLEYKISLYNNGTPLWATTTKESFVVLPEEVRNLLKAGGIYSWQVKAFSAEGALIAISSKSYFKVPKTQ